MFSNESPADTGNTVPTYKCIITVGNPTCLILDQTNILANYNARDIHTFVEMNVSTS